MIREGRDGKYQKRGREKGYEELGWESWFWWDTRKLAIKYLPHGTLVVLGLCVSGRTQQETAGQVRFGVCSTLFLLRGKTSISLSTYRSSRHVSHWILREQQIKTQLELSSPTLPEPTESRACFVYTGGSGEPLDSIAAWGYSGSNSSLLHHRGPHLSTPARHLVMEDLPACRNVCSPAHQPHPLRGLYGTVVPGVEKKYFGHSGLPSL